MPVYRIEVALEATAYVCADTEEEAKAMMVELDCETLELPLVGGDLQASEQLWISGLKYDDPLLPAVSLSPAMTLRILGADGEVPDAERVDDDGEQPA
jgi:hypothetical protein